MAWYRIQQGGRVRVRVRIRVRVSVRVSIRARVRVVYRYWGVWVG